MEENLFYFLQKKLRNPVLAKIAAKFFYNFYFMYYQVMKFFIAMSKDKTLPLDEKKAREILEETYGKKVPQLRKVQHQWETPQYDLSIIITVDEGELYLKECLESVLAQKTHYTFEVIALSDGSKDSSPQILDAYKDHFKVQHYPRLGRSTISNLALEKVKGRYFTFLDADDILTPDAIETWLNSAFKTQADLVQASYYTFDDKGLIGHFPQKNLETGAFLQDEFKDFPGFYCMKVFRRDLFKQVNFPVGYRFEDTIMAFLVYPQVKKAVSLSDELYGYRKHPFSLSRAPGKNVMDTYWILEQMLLDADYLFKENKGETYQATLWLHQLGPQLFQRLRNLEEHHLKAAFVLACQLGEKVPLKKSQTTSQFEEDVKEALLTKNYRLWKLATNMV